MNWLGEAVSSLIKGFFNIIKWVIILFIVVAICMTVIQYGSITQF